MAHFEDSSLLGYQHREITTFLPLSCITPIPSHLPHEFVVNILLISQDWQRDAQLLAQNNTILQRHEPPMFFGDAILHIQSR